MLQKQIVCDRCKKVKKETNHWWMMYPIESENGFTIEPLGEPDFDDPIESEKHLCSEECVIKEVSKFMAKILDIPTQVKKEEIVHGYRKSDRPFDGDINN